jgi:hypothetical protein
MKEQERGNRFGLDYQGKKRKVLSLAKASCLAMQDNLRFLFHKSVLLGKWCKISGAVAKQQVHLTS